MDKQNQKEHNFERRFLCIEYPGIVKNESKMLDTLGGLSGISRAVSEPGLCLGLKFRPEDRFCKSVFGHPVETRGLLLKIKIKRKKNSSSTHNDESPSVASTTVIGYIDNSYVFDSLCDFQYLPVSKTKEGNVESIHDTIIPKTMITKEWLLEPAPSFLIPSYFSRVDVPFPYMFRTEPKDAMSSTKLNLVVRNRKRRVGRTAFAHFSSLSVPTKPTPVAMKSYYPSMNSEIDTLKKLFEERPIWSRGAIVQTTQITENLMNKIIHYVAYYYKDGPWRCMWVRFGYDPKKDPSARIYQILTYRSVRSGLDNKVKAYRNPKNYHIPSQPSKVSNKKVKDVQKDYIFKPGSVPPMRFVFYQLCDIHLPEVKAMIDRLPAPSPIEECDDKNGFLPPGFIDQVREIVKKYIMVELKKFGDSFPNDKLTEEGASSFDITPEMTEDTFSSDEELREEGEDYWD